MSERRADVIPTKAEERIEFVDILRGLAILFILVENMAAFSGQTTNLEELAQPVDRVVSILVLFFLQAKSYSILSLLFGWGMAVQMERVEGRGGRFEPFFLRRLFVLLALGLIHRTLIWFGDILMIYALFGLILMLWRKGKPGALLAWAAAFLAFTVALNVPGQTMDAFRQWYWDATAAIRGSWSANGLNALGTYAEVTRWRIQGVFASLWSVMYYIGSMFGMFLLGVYIAKRRIFRDVEQHLPLVRTVMWVGLAGGLLANWIYVETNLSPGWASPQYLRLVQVGARTLGAATFVPFYVTATILLARRKRVYRRLVPLSAVGRMSVSNYLFQSVVCTTIFYGYGLGMYGEIGPAFGLLLTVVIYAVQVRLSQWWLDGHLYGPVEWLWRTMTYGRSLPMRAGEDDARSMPLVERLRQAVAGIDRRLAWIGLVVVALCIGGVVLWRVRERGIKVVVRSKEVVVHVTPTPGLEEAVPTFAVATPAVQPLVYEPGPVVASGDLLALASTFDAQLALAEIETLTAPPYLGRYPGTPGGQAAGDYIAQRFAEHGLQPAGPDGSYFQPFPVEFTALAREPVLVVVGPDGSEYDHYLPYQDFSPMARQYAGAGTVSGDVVWANNCAPQDLDSADAVDKVVLCRGYSPVEAQRNALEHGASGLLLLTNAEQRPADFGSVYGEAWVPEPLPSFRVFPSVVDEILLGSGMSVLDLSSSFTSFPLQTQVYMEIETVGAEACPRDGCQGRNVLGVLPGRDPKHADEVIVLGAHYDHLGESPGGTAWVGANDDASGVAVLLEVARAWHEQGYVPRRTVLFAAWDAEEWGLIGSQHYVAHPSYPLTSTVAMLQLDMVGAGEDLLRIDGSPEQAQRLGAIAEALDIESEPSAAGRSDHVPFWQAGISANLLIWSYEGVETPHYHRPVDTAGAIEVEKLEAVGRIAGVALLALTEGELDIVELLERRAAAIAAGDLDAFMATSAADQRGGDRFWFDDIQSLSPSSVRLQARDIRILGRAATASVQIEVSYPVEGRTVDQVLDATLPVRFAFGAEEGWQWAGPDLEQSDDQDGFVVRYPPGRGEAAGGLGRRAAERYAEMAALLGLAEQPEAMVLLLPGGEALRASTALSRRFDEQSWVEPGVVKLVYSPEISTSIQLDDTLAQLLLAETGVTQDVALWLWRGLPLVLRAPMGQAAPRYLGDVQAALASESDQGSDATSWAAVETLRQRVGWKGLGQFIADLGQSCREGKCQDQGGLDEALLSSVQMDAATFEDAWQTYWRDRLDAVQTRLDAVLAARTAAVLAGDREAFLDTVDIGVPNLVAEEQHWFADLARHPPQAFSLNGEPIALLDDDSVLAKVTLLYRLDDGSARDRTASLVVRFSPDGGGYRWAGVPFEMLEGDRVRIMYARTQSEQAPALLQEAERAYGLLNARLGLEQPESLVVKLYASDEAFRTSIALSFAFATWRNAWTAHGTSVKLLARGSTPVEVYRSDLAVHLARQLLYQLGVDDEWLLKGGSLYLAQEVDGGAAARAAGSALEALRGADDGTLYGLDAVPPNDELSQDDFRIVNTQAWDMIRYLTYTYGDEALFDLLRLQGQGRDVDAALEETVGQSMAEFTAAWAASLANAHALPTWLDTAERFDPERASEHVEYLASEALAGRQAGSPGAAAAVEYVAWRFAEYGLVTLNDAAVTGYEQRFPISYTELLEAPQIELLDEEDQVLQALVYRQDFVSLLHEFPGWGEVEGELVWIRDAEYQDIELGGKVAVRVPSASVEQEVALAMEHGAGGILLVGKVAGQKRPLAKFALPVTFRVTDTIPVLELTQPGYEQLLELAGETRDGLSDAPPALPLGIRAQVRVPLSPPRTIEAANVLGFLPGSDPLLRDEIVLLSTHYDHVGDDPVAWVCPAGVSAMADGREAACEVLAGLRYPGANDNASGVGVMLEIARLWHESGYRPRRSILFAAWGAQEAGQAGLAYFFDHSVVPLEDVVAVLHLDAVGGGEGYYLGAQGTRDQEGLLRFVMQAAEDALEGRLTMSSPPRSGDPAALFRQADIPTLWLTWREASEENWPAELADEVQPYRLGVTGRMVTLAAMCLAR